jgi:hypothetical protein
VIKKQAIVHVYGKVVWKLYQDSKNKIFVKNDVFLRQNEPLSSDNIFYKEQISKTHDWLAKFC